MTIFLLPFPFLLIHCVFFSFLSDTRYNRIFDVKWRLFMLYSNTWNTYNLEWKEKKNNWNKNQYWYRQIDKKREKVGRHFLPFSIVNGKKIEDLFRITLRYCWFLFICYFSFMSPRNDMVTKENRTNNIVKSILCNPFVRLVNVHLLFTL